MRVVARNVSYRLIAAIFLAIGIGWHFWQEWQIRKPVDTEIPVQILPKPSTLLEKKTLLERRGLVSGGHFLGHIETCSNYYIGDTGDAIENKVEKLRQEACLLESERVRTLIEKNWREHRRSYFEVEYPCADCRPVHDVLIEQDSDGNWQFTIWREPDHWSATDSKEVRAVALKRRRATERDVSHIVGENLLVFIDDSGNEVLSL